MYGDLRPYSQCNRTIYLLHLILHQSVPEICCILIHTCNVRNNEALAHYLFSYKMCRVLFFSWVNCTLFSWVNYTAHKLLRRGTSIDSKKDEQVGMHTSQYYILTNLTMIKLGNIASIISTYTYDKYVEAGLLCTHFSIVSMKLVELTIYGLFVA